MLSGCLRQSFNAFKLIQRRFQHVSTRLKARAAVLTSLINKIERIFKPFARALISSVSRTETTGRERQSVLHSHWRKKRKKVTQWIIYFIRKVCKMLTRTLHKNRVLFSVDKPGATHWLCDLRSLPYRENMCVQSIRIFSVFQFFAVRVH